MAMTKSDPEREERRRRQKEVADSLKESGALDEIFARIDAGECQRSAGSPRRWPWVVPVGGRAGSPGTAMGFPAVQVSGLTPFPWAASVRRTLSPVVTRTWAWCMSRSTRAEAMVRGMSSSKPEGWRFDEMATERRS
jgi:hypothetical protein